MDPRNEEKAAQRCNKLTIGRSREGILRFGGEIGHTQTLLILLHRAHRKRPEVRFMVVTIGGRLVLTSGKSRNQPDWTEQVIQEIKSRRKLQDLILSAGKRELAE